MSCLSYGLCVCLWMCSFVGSFRECRGLYVVKSILPFATSCYSIEIRESRLESNGLKGKKGERMEWRKKSDTSLSVCRGSAKTRRRTSNARGSRTRTDVGVRLRRGRISDRRLDGKGLESRRRLERKECVSRRVMLGG